MEQQTKREAAAVRLVRVINGCVTKDHVAAAARMIRNFEALYGDTLPLSRFLRQREFEITHSR